MSWPLLSSSGEQPSGIINSSRLLSFTWCLLCSLPKALLFFCPLKCIYFLMLWKVNVSFAWWYIYILLDYINTDAGDFSFAQITAKVNSLHSLRNSQANRKISGKKVQEQGIAFFVQANERILVMQTVLMSSFYGSVVYIIAPNRGQTLEMWLFLQLLVLKEKKN